MTADDVSSPTGTPDDAPTGDLVHDVLGEVRRDLAERRRTGELPDLPPGELGRQFGGVIEAVEGAVIEDVPIGSVGLAEAAVLESWRPTGIRGRILGLVLWPVSRLIGAIVRRQVGPFSQRTSEVVNELVDRQNRVQRFLARAHLDRLRSAEYRIAALEREVEELRRSGGAAR